MRSGQISWLSSSNADINAARDVLKSMTPEGVLDELGLGVMLGALSNLFYPAVTTIMRQARYLLFVPAIYKHLEESGGAKRKDADRIVRQLQYELCLALKNGGEKAPIGIESGIELQRPPSAIYWNALAQLGIATRQLSEASYQEQLASGMVGMEVIKDEDGISHPEGDSLWDESAPLPELSARQNFKLKVREADYLLSRYEALMPHGRPSVLTVLVQHGRKQGPDVINAYDKLWDVKGLSEQSSSDVEHARLLSLFARGATLQYHQMLQEAKKENDSAQWDAFNAWFELAREPLLKWDLKEFFALLATLGARGAGTDRDFIRDWIAATIAKPTAKKAFEDAEARKIIRVREKRARGPKARLNGGHYLQTWQPSAAVSDDPYLPVFRHMHAKQIAFEIASAYAGKK